MIDQIKVAGLKEFRRELKKLDGDFPKEMSRVNNDVAGLVADAARSKAAGQGSTLEKAAPSIRAMKGATRAQIAIGSSQYPYALGAEFGSIRYKQFPSPIPGGRSLYPTIRAKRNEVMERYGDLVDDVAKKAFPD